MARLLKFAALSALLSAVTLAAWCNDQANTTGPPNTIPIDTSSPVFVRSVPNGELWSVGNGEDAIQLLHLYGSNGYDFGYAAGLLIPNEINVTLTTAWNYFVQQIEEQINGTAVHYGIPPAIEAMIAEFGLEAVLDWQNDVDRAFINPQIFAEMAGMADATGIPLAMIQRIHMIGEVTKGQCSMYGAWGPATLGGKTLQLRALDWDNGAGLQNHPTVTIYHPQTPQLGVPFANVGWAGWIGTLTGMSSNKLGISEIGVSYPDSTFGNESAVGIPFIFLERQIVQYASSLPNALQMITDANRTCQLILGVGDGNLGSARVIQYSHSIVRFFNDSDLMPSGWWHPRIPQIVYEAMDWVCPYYQHVMADQLTALHGTLTPENTISQVTPVVQTGSLHVAVYDLTDLQLYVANARGDAETTGGPNAYQRQFVKINVGTLFNKSYGAR